MKLICCFVVCSRGVIIFYPHIERNLRMVYMCIELILGAKHFIQCLLQQHDDDDDNEKEDSRLDDDRKKTMNQ